MDQRPQEAAAAIRRRDAQAPDPLRTAGLPIEEQAQTFEIHLGHLRRWRSAPCDVDRIAASTARFEAQAPSPVLFDRAPEANGARADPHAHHSQGRIAAALSTRWYAVAHASTR